MSITKLAVAASTTLPTVASSANAFRSELEKNFPQPSAEREKFVLNSILRYVTKNQLQSTMKTITVDGPNNKLFKVKVMPDYVMIGGQRVPMSGTTAKTVANHFGMKLPDANMSRLIHQKADVQIAAKPLSGTGTVVDGKKLSGNQVVQTGVGHASFVGNYNDFINQELSQKNVKPDQIVSGFAKDIVDLPGSAGNKYLGLYGFWDKNNVPIQGGLEGTGKTVHENKYHSEYGAFARLWDPENIEVIDKTTGKSSKVTGDDFKKLLDQTKGAQPKPSIKPPPPTAVAKATPPKPTSKPPAAPAKPGGQPAGGSQPPAGEKVDDFLATFTNVIEDRRLNIIKRALKLI